jgi:PPK2 family polyphosphate:nucleotide phosphotransferase
MVRGAVRLDRLDPRATPGCRDKREAAARLAKLLERLEALQYRLYAGQRRSLLLVLQGMDTAGKDGVIRKVMTAFNPQGCRVTSFKRPTAEEATHDFLWRIHRVAPAAGEVAVFNRSHYEDVVAVRVHALTPRADLKRRYDAINDFERHLEESGTKLVKCFLHISRAEQHQRLLERLEQPHKHWKFNEGDLAERTRWNDYRRAYEIAFERCSTAHAPWYVIPSDRKWYRDLAVAEIVCGALEGMDLKLPEVSLDVRTLRAELDGRAAVGATPAPSPARRRRARTSRRAAGATSAAT